MWQFTAIVVGKGGVVGGRHNSGFICLAAGSLQPLGHGAAGQGRAAAVRSAQQLQGSMA